MSLMEWNEKLSVGVPGIDEQHKKLVAMLNEFYDAMQAKHGFSVVAAYGPWVTPGKIA